jgi:hypothetical protein
MRKTWIFGIVFLFCIMSVMGAVPSVTFLNQSPTDITTTNIVANSLKIWFNITDDGDDLVLNTILLHSKNVPSGNDYSYFENGTGYTGFNTTDAYVSNASSVFLWNLTDNSVYPGSYNFNWKYTRNAEHLAGSLGNSNNWLLVEILNMSSTTGENYFEIMANNSAGGGTDYGKIYYCNSTYTTGSPLTSTSCLNIYNIPTNSYNHCHSATSCHQLASFGIVAGKIGAIDVTQTSYFLVNGRTGSNVQYWYISNTTRNNANKISGNGGTTWTNGAYTVDAHIHQYDGTDTYSFYACAGDGVNETCTTAISQLLTTGSIATLPTIPTVYTPEYETGVCPTDTLQSTIMFCFLGLLLVVGFWYSDTKNFGLGLIAVGVLTIFYSLPLYGCSFAWGLVLTFIGIMVGIYAWKLKYY